LRKNEALRQRVEEDLAAIKKDRSLVRSFFMAPSVSYASYQIVTTLVRLVQVSNAYMPMLMTLPGTVRLVIPSQ